jgi:lipoprotein-releasing system permease protein
MVNGLWGVGLGSISGIFLSQYLNDILALFGVNIFGAGYAMQQLPIQLEINNVVFIAISALAMSFVANLYPAFQASNTQPAEVLRNE